MPDPQTNGSGFLDGLNQELWLYQPLLVLASTLLWGIYVYFTIRTFRQIKRQTDLQTQAFLIVAAQKVDAGRKLVRAFPPGAQELHDKWRGILQKNLPNAMQPDKWLVLKLTNRGRADIVKWAIEIRARIKPGDYLDKKCNTRGEEQNWTVCYRSHQDIVALESGTGVEVPIAIISAFPSVEFSWTISYEDTRHVKYQRFGGDSGWTDSNVLALVASGPTGPTGPSAPL
jgi:hypothetical protein